MKDLDLLFRHPRRSLSDINVDEVVDALRKEMPKLYDIAAHARLDPAGIREYENATRLLRLARDMELVSQHLLTALDPAIDNPVTIDGEVT